MPTELRSRVLKAAIGFLIGLSVWGGLSGPYTRLLAAATEGVIRLGESPAVTHITADRTMMAVDRDDFPSSPSILRLGIESTDITFNFILLVTLFAASRRPLSDRNMFGFAGAACMLALVHIAAVMSFVKAYYALSFGAWSELHYGRIARSLWGAAPYFYSVVGVYGSAFALWWLFGSRNDSNEVVVAKLAFHKRVHNRRHHHA